MVLHDTDNAPCIVVIDYNKADLKTKGMKITGLEEKFGWKRLEKTRFLTLLKPDNFEKLSIEVFDQRLKDLMAISIELLRYMTKKTFEGFETGVMEADEAANLVVENIVLRRNYINTYFRRWFKERNITEEQAEDDRYGGFGQSFLDYYKRKK